MKLHKKLLSSIWLLITLSFLVGVCMPLANVRKLLLFNNEFSVLGSLWHLATDPSASNILILLIIFLFSLVFPIAKLATMLWQIRHYESGRENSMTRFVEAVGHFSMLDVFIIALMVLLLKLKVLVDVVILQGFYWFSFSIVASILLSAYLRWARKKTTMQ